MSKETNRERNTDFLNELKHGDDYNKEHKAQGNKGETASAKEDALTEQEKAEAEYKEQKKKTKLTKRKKRKNS
ncbi:hypothetical protein [Nosocomiicoccus massiliensis]|uniref:hypothetical protein n=1 Tax=Nosocomiicoccus massiliensis TaxID=1232430 RepID=UPI00040E199A|nr:hypothetical protein [Nosocomiicoccus massiliensis]